MAQQIAQVELGLSRTARETGCSLVHVVLQRIEHVDLAFLALIVTRNGAYKLKLPVEQKVVKVKCNLSEITDRI